MMLKIAIFNCDAPKEQLVNWGNFSDMAITMLEQSCDAADEAEYDVYQVYKDEFPSLEELKSYSGIYITGSEFDAFDNSRAWIVHLKKIINVVLTEDGYPPVTGVCFGHQIVASSLGCKVDRNPQGMEGGIVPLQLTEDAKRLGLLQKPHPSTTHTFSIAKIHNDIVYEIPEGYVNIASSQKCPIQGLYKKHKAFTLQGHPEFVTQVSMLMIQRAYEHGKIDAHRFEAIKAESAQNENDGIYAAKTMWKLFKREL
ncbi:LANO_0H10660g1_1 [Lachancea nothofagi CBS 11611]|uniref:LANO_0H10660g1_1 n=1 Tax=Lachancea nothofagi CBS 11611 TaxID=1266666 RepID=A0A1G4KM00_9SACH|nr:LANO_0H10660g1_1 [Lachancea nothofagi CBS 11611]